MSETVELHLSIHSALDLGQLELWTRLISTSFLPGEGDQVELFPALEDPHESELWPVKRRYWRQLSPASLEISPMVVVIELVDMGLDLTESLFERGPSSWKRYRSSNNVPDVRVALRRAGWKESGNA